MVRSHSLPVSPSVDASPSPVHTSSAVVTAASIRSLRERLASDRPPQLLPLLHHPGMALTHPHRHRRLSRYETSSLLRRRDGRDGEECFPTAAARFQTRRYAGCNLKLQEVEVTRGIAFDNKKKKEREKTASVRKHPPVSPSRTFNGVQRSRVVCSITGAAEKSKEGNMEMT